MTRCAYPKPLRTRLLWRPCTRGYHTSGPCAMHPRAWTKVLWFVRDVHRMKRWK